ncbi:MAG: hypothetical protein LIP11_03340, partial [Clostridiales bacterium]|nr:hypothetical protein [Clostridiales bacterium]
VCPALNGFADGGAECDRSAVQTRSVSFHGQRDLPPTNGRGQFHEKEDAAGEEDKIDTFRELYVGACDGHATERILRLIGFL